MIFILFVFNACLFGQNINSLSKSGQLDNRMRIKKHGISSCRKYSIKNGNSTLVSEWKYNQEGCLSEFYEYGSLHGDIKYKRVYEYFKNNAVCSWMGYANGNGSPCYIRHFFYHGNWDVVSATSQQINRYGETINYSDDNSFTYSYDENGYNKEITLYDNNKNVSSNIVNEFAPNGNLLRSVEKKKSQYNPIIKIYKYDENNLLISEQEDNGYSKTDFEYKYTMMSPVKKIETIVQNKINQWQTKGKFEKFSEYSIRVTEKNRNDLVNNYTAQVIDSLGSLYSFTILSSDYDIDNESYKITFENFGTVFLKIPQNEAPEFEKNSIKWKFLNPKFVVINDFFSLAHLEVKCKKAVYTYNINDQTKFVSNQFKFSFDSISIPVQSQYPKNIVNQKVNIKSEVDYDIPETSYKSGNTYALIIGNEDYTKFQTGLTSEANVEFARNDASVFAQYCEKTLGIPKENIVLLTDGISSQMRREIEKLCKLAKYSNGQASLIFYYAGHGFPEESTKQSYIIPVDVTGINVTDGIQLRELYLKLTESPVKRVTVVLDACFSGGGRNKGLLATRAVRFKPQQNALNGNIIVFSASSEDQTSLGYKEKNHGMFTYFLLKELQETKGSVSYNDLFEYIKQQVQITSIRVNGKDQNPEVNVSPSIEGQWKSWKMK